MDDFSARRIWRTKIISWKLLKTLPSRSGGGGAGAPAGGRGDEGVEERRQEAAGADTAEMSNQEHEEERKKCDMIKTKKCLLKESTRNAMAISQNSCLF